MAKVITDIYGFAQEIQRQFGCDRQVIEALCDRFSENVVIAVDKESVAEAIRRISFNWAGRKGWGNIDSLLEDRNIDWNRLIDECRDIDQEQVGYTYEAIGKLLSVSTHRVNVKNLQKGVAIMTKKIRDRLRVFNTHDGRQYQSPENLVIVKPND